MGNFDRWGAGPARRLTEFGGEEEWDGVYSIVGCRRALSPSGLPGMDYSLNPYGGCEHGCVYCYAPEVLHSEWKTWRIVRVKADIAERLAKELPGLSGTIGIGTVTDPYQAAERRFRLTRRCLELLSERKHPVFLLTKSDFVLRDTDILARLRGHVAVTLTGLDGRRSLVTEPGAPLPEARLKALRGLTEAGIDTCAFIAPVLDHLEGAEREFCDAVAETGVRNVILDSLNMRPGISERMGRMNIRGSAKALETIRTALAWKGLWIQDVSVLRRRESRTDG